MSFEKLFNHSALKALRYLTSLLLALLVVAIFAEGIQAADSFSVSSSDSAILDKKQGTVRLIGSVSIVQKTTGSTLKADEIFLRRNRLSGKLVYAKATKFVEALLIQKKTATQSLGIRKTKVFCNEAVFDKDKSTAYLEGNVLVVSYDMRMTAEKLRYDLKEENGVITNLPGKKVVFLFSKERKPSQGFLTEKPDQQGLVEGKASEIRFSESLNKLVLQGNVTLYDHDEEASFASEKADLFFNQKDELEMIIAYGNVKLTQPKRSSISDRVDFDYIKEIVTLTGNATLKEVDQLEISSSIIRMHMDEDKGMVESGQSTPVRMKTKIDVQ